MILCLALGQVFCITDFMILLLTIGEELGLADLLVGVFALLCEGCVTFVLVGFLTNLHQ